MKRYHTLRTIIATLLCLMMVTPTRADVLTLPSGTKVIEEYAFYGDTSINEVVLPEGIEEIGDYAFAESGLTKINLPSTLEEGSIADNAIDKDKDIEVTAIEGTDAYNWAVDNGFINKVILPELPATDFKYADNGDGTCTITSYKGGTTENFVIPSKNPDGLTVTAIADSAFVNSNKANGKLVIPATVTSIGRQAFLYCSGLTGDLIIPDSVTDIGVMAFDGCDGFNGSIRLGNGLLNIGENAFSGCSNLTGNLIIPNSVTNIGTGAFYECNGFNGKLVLSKNIASIAENTFTHCSGFVGGLVIPDKVVSIGGWAFFNCGFTGNLVLGTHLTDIGDNAFESCGFTGDLLIPDNVIRIGDSAFGGCSGFNGSLTIGNGLTCINEKVFSGCSGFSGRLTIGENVATIGEYAFSNCSGFTGDLVIPDGVVSINRGAFNGCKGFSGDLIIGDGLTSIGSSLFSYMNFTGQLLIGNSVSVIEDYAFRYSSGFTGDLIIPSNVTSIGKYAFEHCSGFDGNLVLSNGLISIGAYAFSECDGLTGNLNVPNSVTSIGEYAFNKCNGFDGDLIIGDGVTNIGSYAFWNCDGFTGNLRIGDGVKCINYSAFSGCSGFSGRLTLGNKLETINSYAFSGCSGLMGNLVIPDSVTLIERNAFSGCSGFDGVLVLSSNITDIADNTFSGCSKLSGRLRIPSGVTRIGNYAFQSCYSFTGDLSIPDSVTSIGNYSFYECRGFDGDLKIGNNVISIGERAFISCGFKGRLTIGNRVESIGNYAFAHNSGLTGDLLIPQSVSTIGSSAFSYCSNLFGTMTIGDQITSFSGSPFFIGGISTYIFGNMDSIYCMNPSSAWDWLSSHGYMDKLVEWDGVSDTNNSNVTFSQFVSFSTGSDFIGQDEEVTSTKENGDIVSRIQYPLTPGMELSIPFRTDSDAVKATVKLRYWNEYYHNYYTYCVDGEEVAASTTQFQTDADGKTGVLKLTLPSGSEIRTDLYVLQLWSKNSRDTVVDARVKIKVKSDPWTGYVQADYIPTYEGPTGSTLRGLYVDNTDPVKVLDVEENRYKIEMTLDNGKKDERWVDKEGIKETYMPWIGYVQESSVSTYSSSSSSAPNGQITDQYPVKVLMVEGSRYRITVQNGDNAPTEIWVNKSKIGKTEKKGEITDVSFTDAGRGLLIGNPYSLQIVGNAAFEKITVTCMNCQSITITDPPEFRQGIGYVWQTSFWPPAVGGEALLIVKGFAGDVEIAKKTLTIYSAEEISAADRSEYSFTAETSNNRVWAIPDSNSEPVDTAELNSEFIVYGAYPSLKNLEYYYASYFGTDGKSHEGFVRNDSQFIINWLEVTNQMTYFTVTAPAGYSCEYREGYYKDDNVVYILSGRWFPATTGTGAINSNNLVDDEHREIGSIIHVEFRAYKEDYAGNREYLDKIITRDVAVASRETTSITPGSTAKINLLCAGLTNNAVRLSWTCGEIPNDGWRVYHSLDDNPQGSWDVVGDVRKDNPHIIDPNAEAGRMNYYYVEGKSRNSNNEIETSEIIAIYPIECPRLEINGYKVADRSDAATIMWNGEIPYGLKGEVYWSDLSDGEYRLLQDNLTAQGGCLAEGMPSDGVLYFKLRYYRDDTVNGKTIRSNSEWDTPVSVRMQAEGTFRSLIMVWEEFATCLNLSGHFETEKDALYSIFSSYTPEGLPWNSNDSIAEKNLSVGEVYDYISAMSRLAHDNDITWVHISTHGNPHTTTEHNSGALVIDKKHEDGSFTTNTLDLSVLAMWLNNIPGRVIVSLGSCGSGSATADAANIAFSEMNTTISVPNKLEYASEGYVGSFRQGKFIVFTGSQTGESAWGSELVINLNGGYRNLKNKTSDHVITLSQMSAYLEEKSGKERSYTHSNGTTVTGIERFTVYPSGRFFELFKPVSAQQ